MLDVPHFGGRDAYHLSAFASHRTRDQHPRDRDESKDLLQVLENARFFLDMAEIRTPADSLFTGPGSQTIQAPARNCPRRHGHCRHQRRHRPGQSQAERLFGYEPRRVAGPARGNTCAREPAAKTRSAPRRISRTAAHSAHGQRPRTFGRRKDGTVFPIEISLSPARRRQRLFRERVDSRHLRPQKSARGFAPRAKSASALLVDEVKDYAIFMLDPTARVQTWNEGAQKIKGYAPRKSSASIFRASTYPRMSSAASRKRA